jgi:guanylate kinase
MRGTLYIVAAPSGAGKSSIVNAVLARDPNIALSISFTSRQPRPGERHAEHYHFVSAAEFEAMVDAGDFFEHALVHGDWKGTARPVGRSRSWPPARTCCWKSTGRARARCAARCRMR